MRRRVIGAACAALAACATPRSTPPPQSPQPPPIAQKIIPDRPLPPAGADYAMTIPPLAADGRRITINTNLNDNQTLWHFRSGWNVAALNCQGAKYAPILAGYREFLTRHQVKLAATNTALEAAYDRAQNTRDAGVTSREQFMTQLYNYFALPPAQNGFCQAALGMATEYLATPPRDPVPFANTHLARLDAVFAQFFADYDRYRMDSAAWDARYGARYGASQPGYVAVHGTGGVQPVQSRP